jgi:predicted ATP-grasp superfamily ATP-dependent carboligase
MGDVDVVRALGVAGIRCALFALPDERARYSRHVAEVLPWVDHWQRPQDVASALMKFAARQDVAPVVFPQTDGDLLVISRQRERLAGSLRHCLADATLIEDLVDKERFAALADRAALPVPATGRLDPSSGRGPADLDLCFPLVVKPIVRRQDRWAPLSSAKARHVATPDELADVWELLVSDDLRVLVQEAIPGPESLVESYHAYVDASGEVVAEFTGRKIRTLPSRYGTSTAVEITDAPELARLGRELYARIGLRGVAKADFKRDRDGCLKLLEINPRFTLWHHPAAFAGVNIPALVHADLSGRPRPRVRPASPGVTWCDPLADLRAARAAGQSTAAWLRWSRGCEARSGFAWDDPAPMLRAGVWPVVRGRLGRLAARTSRRA